jgi:hypothetical protein
MSVINDHGKEWQTEMLHMPFHQHRNVGGEMTQDESKVVVTESYMSTYIISMSGIN